MVVRRRGKELHVKRMRKNLQCGCSKITPFVRKSEAKVPWPQLTFDFIPAGDLWSNWCTLKSGDLKCFIPTHLW